MSNNHNRTTKKWILGADPGKNGAIVLINAKKKFGEFTSNDVVCIPTKTNNGKIDVAVYELPPVVVTKDNAKEVFANDPGRMELLK